MSADWFQVVTGPDLEQGDILLECPTYTVESRVQEGSPATEVIEEILDVVVLTQSCDLENHKVDQVLVAAVLPYDALVEREGASKPNIRGKNFRQAAVAGNLPPYSLLPARDLPPALRWSLVDFHHLFSIPKAVAVETANTAGARLRLRSPYREHLAQAFARYIMRVGLPTGLNDFVDYSPAAS